jgi:RHH-type proline utilization regulon transcriptional repressor/proline dehydrogenase/delta 1-pyrroline-5-carboxylate dehydrogenase
MEGEIQPLMGLLAREAGKTFANAIAEVREAVDFLRYYAVQARNDFSNDAHRPLGPVVCISPWNFPLAIFSGQVAAALAAGNPVLAKPAEQTPLVAAQAVRIAARSRDSLKAWCNCCRAAAKPSARGLVGDERVKGVMFTGSTEVARLLQRNIAGRLDSPGPSDSADRRNRWPERNDRRLVGTDRTSRDRRGVLGIRQRRSTLLGTARAVPAGRFR